jgi:hypothetical protein
VAIWTGGRLRGSAVYPPAPSLRGLGHAAFGASKDGRFAPPLTAADLAETTLEVSFLHGPSVPLPRAEIETRDAYPDKAAFVWKGTRSGIFLPEVFNLGGPRLLRGFATRLASEKAGLEAFDEETSLEVSEVTGFVESADRTHAVPLDGPVAGLVASSEADGEARRREAGTAACAWLAAIQRDDGSLPLRVKPQTGKTDGLDVPRMALTAQALSAFGLAWGLESAVGTARRLNAWIDAGSRSSPPDKPTLALMTACYRGKTALCLGEEEAVVRASVAIALRLEPGVPREPLVLAHVASFFAALPDSWRGETSERCASLRRELSHRFTQAKSESSPMSLAEWAEMAAAFPVGSGPSREVTEWLTTKQLDSGAFPESTARDFAYTRGSGKILEVLALEPQECKTAIERCLNWLYPMQYRPDSMFFVPEEHRSLVVGGFRHDAFDTAAWIDAAAHFLLGLARLAKT